MKPTLRATLLFVVFALVAGVGSCAAGVYHYVSAVLRGCNLYDKYVWLSFPLMLLAACLLFRWTHSLAGASRETVARRTWFLGTLMVVLWISAWIIMPGQTGAIDRSRQKRTMADMRTVGVALGQYFNAHGAYPQTDDPVELQHELAEYVRKLPTHDGWRNPLVFRVTSSSYTVVSWGKCGQPDVPSSLDCEPGTISSIRADIVYSNGRFVRWPEGIQAD